MEEMDDGCLSSVSYAVLVNGSAKGWVKASRGLRQEERNMLEGFRVGRNRTRVNLDKSNIYGINLDQAHISRLAETLDARLLAGLYSIWVFLWVGTQGSYPLQCCKNREVAEGFFMVRDWEGKRDHLVSSMASGHTKHYGSHSNGWDANTIVRWSHLSLEGYSQVFQSFPRLLVCGRKWGKNSFWEDLWWGDQPLGSQYPRLFRVVLDKNIPISSVLGPTRPFSWNLNFRRNLSDSEIEDLEGLMRL
ncbi:hypothetical protein CK203_094820 [Vitis vinifera]|uniref:Reverse transcriptase zinc-binding domain-containing protein n=1 Tax=Vitis vinifera TaxID=29760 RepID=A0A438CZG3_VITVI|nr:hypothetical protein CK203_094820 [Vitis vinifera]